MSRETAREDGVPVDPVTLLAHQLWNDPKTREGMEDLVATLNPERAPIAVPGHVLRKQFEEERAAIRKERDEFKAERETAKQEAEAARLREKVYNDLRKHGAQARDIEPVTKLMNERLIADPEAAMELYRKQQKLAEPTSGRFGVQIPGPKAGEFFKGMDENLDQWARDRAAQDIHIIKTHGVQHLETLAPSPLR